MEEAIFTHNEIKERFCTSVQLLLIEKRPFGASFWHQKCGLGVKLVSQTDVNVHVNVHVNVNVDVNVLKAVRLDLALALEVWTWGRIGLVGRC